MLRKRGHNMIKDHPSIFQGSVEAFLQSNQRFFACPMDIARNILALPFVKGQGHPFTEGMVDYLAMPSRSANQTRMALFYERYQPKNLLEAFFGGIDHPLLDGLTTFDLEPLVTLSSKWYVVPWVQEPIKMGGFGEAMPEAAGSHYLGPVSDQHLFSEFERIKAVVHSVQTHGFDVEKQTDTIRGYFLMHQDRPVMVVVGGNHRVGALAAMNSPYVPIERHPERPSVVRLEEIDQWPLVANGTFTIPMAKAIFLRFYAPSNIVI
jgi:hypothetical protein